MGKQICFTIVWSGAEIFTQYYLVHKALSNKDISVLEEPTEKEVSAFGFSLVRVNITFKKKLWLDMC